MTEFESELIEFYGIECTHCNRMMPSVERLEEELGVKIQRFEVWHNEENANLMKQFDRGFCGGVPFFFNRKSGKWICGATSYENLKKWAQGK